MQPQANRIRFTLRGALLATCILALGLAWFVDHVRLQTRLRKLTTQSDVQHDQIANLQAGLESLQRARDKRLTLYWWSSADEFIDAFVQTEHDGDSMEMAVSLSRCNDEVLNESLKRLIELIGSDHEQIRSRTVRAIGVVHQQHPERIVDLTPQIVSALIPLIDDQNERAAIHPIRLLGNLGPSAKEAIVPLRTRMMDDSSFSAPYAAGALAKIDSTIDVGPRLVEFVTQRKPERSWIAAAQVLVNHIEPVRAREILMETYEQSDDALDRRKLLSALNGIKVDAKPTDAPKDRASGLDN